MRPGPNCVPDCEPDLFPIVSGELLAATPRDHPYRIGVTGWTLSEVQQRFKYALGRWREMHLRGKAACHDEGAVDG